MVSYDIACQWSKNLTERCLKYGLNPLVVPSRAGGSLKFNDKVDIVFLVPKFHLPAHVIECQTRFSFNLHPKVGRTDGEAPERGWSDLNGIASSTQEMGPGSRHDTLEDHFADYNWGKISQIGMSLCVSERLRPNVDKQKHFRRRRLRRSRRGKDMLRPFSSSATLFPAKFLRCGLKPVTNGRRISQRQTHMIHR